MATVRREILNMETSDLPDFAEPRPYIVVSAYNVPDLSWFDCAAIEKGYTPIGGVSPADIDGQSGYIQAVHCPQGEKQ